MTQARASGRFVYIGCRTTRERHARGRGIGVFAMDDATGALTPVQVVEGLVNPSFLTLAADGRHLYTVHGDRSEATAFRVQADGRLQVLRTTDTGGRNPVHLALDAEGRHLVVANHLSSNVVVMPVLADGTLGAPTQVVELTGEPGPHRIEQPFAKPHQVVFDRSGRHLAVPDKGLDKVFVYAMIDGRLTPATVPWTASREGAGPRHAVFHPQGEHAYAVNELDSTVTAYRVAAATGAWTPIQVSPTLDARFTGNSRAAAIVMDSAGRFVYASNRGSDSIAVFAVQADGTLGAPRHVASGGRTPRCLAMAPGDRWLYALNEDSDTVVVFAIDADSGVPVATGHVTAFESPVCLVFSPDVQRAVPSR